MNRGTFIVSVIVAAIASSVTLAYLGRSESTKTLEFISPDFIGDIGYYELWQIREGTAELIEMVIPLRESRYAVTVEPGCYALVAVTREMQRSNPTSQHCWQAEASITDQQVRDLLSLSYASCPNDHICLEDSSPEHRAL